MSCSNIHIVISKTLQVIVSIFLPFGWSLRDMPINIRMITIYRSFDPNVDGWCHNGYRTRVHTRNRMNIQVDGREQMKLEAHQTIQALQLFEQASRMMNMVVVERCGQVMADPRKELFSSMGAPATINVTFGGSINSKQQIGAKRGATPTFLKNLLTTYWQYTREDYKEVLVVLRGNWQYVRPKRFNVCIMMACHWLQETIMQIATKIVGVSCHPLNKEP